MILNVPKKKKIQKVKSNFRKIKTPKEEISFTEEISHAY